jgi:RNA polymerase sigma-70 factor (ECF subfamily)
MSTGDQEAILAAARAGDESAFAALVEPHRRELRVHCYRMLGSFDEAEDLVQDTFLRAWKAIGGFAGRSTVRAWLYRIATNACLDALDGRARRVLPHQVNTPSGGGETSWLQPFRIGCGSRRRRVRPGPRASPSPGRRSSWRSWSRSSSCRPASGRR